MGQYIVSSSDESYFGQTQSPVLIDKGLLNQRKMARWREAFFTKHTKTIRELLYSDLQRYVAGSDIRRMKLFTLDEFVPSFLRKITDIYNNPIHFRFDDDVDEDNKERLNELKSDEIIFKRFINKNNRRTRLHGTNLVYVRYNEKFDDIYLNHLHRGNCWVVPYPHYKRKPLIVMYRRKINDEDRYYIWHREKKEHYYVKEDEPDLDAINGEVEVTDDEKIPVADNTTIEAPDYFPFVAYRYDDEANRFWCSGMDSLIEFTRSLNTLLTVTNDDLIQETIKILILNFDPNEAGGSKDGGSNVFKAGLRHPFCKKSDSSLGGEESEPTGEVVQGDLFVQETMEFIEKITGMICGLYDVENLMKTQDMKRVTGEALRLKYSFLEKNWREDVGLLKRYDRELLETVINVNNYHRTGDDTVDRDILSKMEMEYEKPSMTMKEGQELANAQTKWKNGLSNPAEYLAKKENITEEEAKKRIQENKELTEELVGRTTSLGMTNTQNNQEV